MKSIFFEKTTNKTIQYMLMLFILFTLTPFFQRNYPQLYIGILLLTTLLLCLKNVISSLENKLEKKDLNIFFIVCSWLFIIFIYYLYNSFQTFRGNFYNVFLFYFNFVILIYVKNNFKTSSNYRKLYILLIIVLTNTISNIYLMIKDPVSSKYYTGNVKIFVEKYDYSNLMDITHVTATVLLVPSLIYLYLNIKDKSVKLLALTTLLGLVYLVYLSSSFITLLSLIITYVFWTILKSKNLITKYLNLTLLLILILILFFMKNYIMNYLISISLKSSNFFYTQRLNEVYQFMLGNSKDGSLSERMDNIKISLQTFYQNFLTGRGFIYSSNVNETGIGMHSQLIDDLARFGLIGLLFTISIFYIYIKLFKKSRGHSYINFTVVLFTVLSLINPTISIPVGTVLFIVNPLIIQLVSENKNYDQGVNND